MRPDADAGELHGYRDPAPPPPARFALHMGTAARLGLAAGAGAVALTIAIWALTGSFFVLFLAAGGPGLVYLLSGAPRALEVGRDAITIRFWMRPAVHLRTADVISIQIDDDDVLFVTRDRTVAIALARLAGADVERCLEALRSVVPPRA